MFEFRISILNRFAFVSMQQLREQASRREHFLKREQVEVLMVKLHSFGYSSGLSSQC
jgi:hypothetical protein